MPTTYTDLIADVRRRTKQVSLEELRRRLDAGEPLTLVDVREKDEWRAGYIPGAVSIPRGFLEIHAEQKLPDRSARIVAYWRSSDIPTSRRRTPASSAGRTWGGRWSCPRS